MIFLVRTAIRQIDYVINLTIVLLFLPQKENTAAVPNLTTLENEPENG